MKTAQQEDAERIADRWDDSEWATGVPVDYWSVHPIIEAYIGSTITPFEGAMQTWFTKTFLQGKACERALSVCCGMGMGDRQAISAGLCKYLEGFDISTGSINYAKNEAQKAGMAAQMHYWVADANTIELEEERYDVALAFGALHHVENLEHMSQQLRRAVKPDGYILVNEYVGPKRLQWTDEQLTIINRVMEIMPPQWRRSARVERPNEAHMIAGDPSEAVRADEVVSVLSQYFEVVDHADYGGGLLMPLWSQGIIPRVFLEDSHADKQVIIKLLVMIDELLVEHGIAPSNYGQVVLRNRPPAQSQQVATRTPINTPARHMWTSMWLPGTQFAHATPPWRLPLKAWRVLQTQGASALRDEVKQYLQWIQSRPK